ncbi:hypothetical protein HYC85_005675 [Camellia sinensis]|uniref:Uncharacterized protein n=1 Tax=Camellia sinensis TaxID=4442 RepID=A0A7J7I063_CAMSI|nr:hypothetical protein HYC85_005675 [Camellia sinensis]
MCIGEPRTPCLPSAILERFAGGLSCQDMTIRLTGCGLCQVCPYRNACNSLQDWASGLRASVSGNQFHLRVFIVAVLAIIPLVPRNLSNRAYRLSFMGTACSSLFSLYSLYGKPRAWNLQAVQVWFQSVIATKDFVYFIYCLTFVTSNLYLKFALIPILCRALEYVAKFLRRNFTHSSLYRKYLEEACVWVESNTTTLSILSSQAEIGLGFLLILSLFSWQRNIIQTFMYWQVCFASLLVS